MSVVLLLVLLVQQVQCEECEGEGCGRRGPVFTAEPAGAVSVREGALLPCAALHALALDWLGEDGAPLASLPGLWRVHANGSLQVWSAAGGRRVRCRARGAAGALLSRDVHLLGPAPPPRLRATRARGAAALRCYTAGPARPPLWFYGDEPLPLSPPTLESQYVAAGEWLLIRAVAEGEGAPYACLARHRYTGEALRSRPASLALAAADPDPPATLDVTANEDGSFCLPCALWPRSPPPYTWYRESEGRVQPVRLGEAEGLWAWGDGAALCGARAAREPGALWVCEAGGGGSARARLSDERELTVRVRPEVAVARGGGAARLQCAASSAAAALQWLHDGEPVAGARGAVLELRAVGRAHRGLYQCVARDGLRSAQAAAELRLGESPPELQYTFIEQAVRGGGAVSLRCVASGTPPPRVEWLLDGRPLERALPPARYRLLRESSPAGDAGSVLTLQQARPDDGGLYTCLATNPLGRAEHSARLNVYGPPGVRAVEPQRVVAGENVTVLCPYTGYPISLVEWSRRGAEAVVGSGEGRVRARGAALRLSPALPRDAGLYTCTVAGPEPADKRVSLDIEIQVLNPPKISPFIFSPELTEGSSAQVLCGVSSGDKPLYFSWLKDGAPLPPSLQIEEKSLNDFSLLMFSELRTAHAGAYTCRVRNEAAAAEYSAPLRVRAAPRWSAAPRDLALLLAAPLRLHCAAAGVPPPLLTWYKLIDATMGAKDVERWEEVGERETKEQEGEATFSAARSSRAHAGLYRCRADNGVPPPLDKRINVTVYEPANFVSQSERNRNISTAIGGEAALTCEARGDAPLSVYWTRGGARLPGGERRAAVEEARTAAGARSTLRLRAARREDAGEYRCHAHNAFGRSDLLLYVHVQEPPEKPSEVRLQGVGADWVRVRWRAAAGAQYTAHVAERPAGGERAVPLLGAGEARVSGLRAARRYSLRLSAHSAAGRSPLSEPLLFDTLEDAPSAAPRELRRAAPAPPRQLLLTWTSPEPETWNGELLGFVVEWREVDGEVEGAGAAAGVGARGGREVARGSELLLDALRPLRRHRLTVRAFNRAGLGPPSLPLTHYTADDVPWEAPAGVRCEAVSSGALRVRWLPAPPLRYELLYAPTLPTTVWSGGERAAEADEARAGEAVVGGLRAATPYRMQLRARSAAGPGPPSAPLRCTTKEDVAGAPEAVRAVPAAADAVRVTWLPPRAEARAGRLTHYTLYARELAKVGGEWSQRVEAGGAEAQWWGGREERHELRGLREHAVYEVWVRASTAAGAGAPSRVAFAAPSAAAAARVSSLGRVVLAPVGARLRLACAAVGAPPLERRWSPLPAHYSITPSGDLVIHKLEENCSRNFTCTVRNSLGGEAVQHAVRVVRPPSAPAAPRLERATRHSLRVRWEAPAAAALPLLGYTLRWERAGAAGEVQLPRGELAHEVRGLECGARYSVSVRAQNALGDSPPSPAVHMQTLGDKARAGAGRDVIWANSSALRVSLLAWGGRCGVAAWRAAVRDGRGWRELRAEPPVLELGGLRPAAWYDLRLDALSPAGHTRALYRAATRTLAGETIGEPMDLVMEEEASAEEAGPGAAQLSLYAACGAAALAACAALRLRARPCARAAPHSTPHYGGKLEAKVSTQYVESGEISPYATFSAAPAPRPAAPRTRPPHLLALPNDYGSARSSESESSSSACGCHHPAHLPPPAHLLAIR